MEHNTFLWLVEIGLTISCALWVKDHYFTCQLPTSGRSVFLGLVIFNSIIFLTAIITIWCVFDVAGRSWVKLKNYQKSLRDQGTKSKKSKLQYKRSGGNPARSWRHRKVRRAYQTSWDNRCQILFCCVRQQDRKTRSSFADIARVLSEFFRDLDVVPSDVIVGLVLLRQRQQLIRFRVVHQSTNSVFTFLSGVRVTPDTHFLDVAGKDLPIILEIHHFMHFAVGMYGWPMYLRKNTGISTLRLCSSLRCEHCLPCCQSKPLESVIVDDNCCGCNFAAYQRMCHLPDTYVIYITYHVDVGETPFLIAIDYSRKAVVLSVRGTLSLQDVLTDLNAEGEPLPIRPVNEEWIGHKGMVNAAAYIYKKVKEEHLLTKAFNWDKDRGTDTFNIVCVGHSLGAGTAAILAIMLKQEYPETKCFSFSPPGGLLSQQAVEFSRSFITSVVLGKDVVPRIGLHQLESLRHNLIGAIHKSKDPKWKTLVTGLTSSVGRRKEWTQADVEAQLTTPPTTKKPCASTEAYDLNIHPWDSTVNLSVHQPLYPPGQIIHIVRNYPKSSNPDEVSGRNEANSKRGAFKRSVQPIYRAILAANQNFDEVLISKRMVQDHMPDNVIDALEKMLDQNNIKTQIYDSGAYVKARHDLNEAESGWNRHLPESILETNGCEIKMQVSHESNGSTRNGHFPTAQNATANMSGQVSPSNHALVTVADIETKSIRSHSSFTNSNPGHVIVVEHEVHDNDFKDNDNSTSSSLQPQKLEADGDSNLNISPSKKDSKQNPTWSVSRESSFPILTAPQGLEVQQTDERMSRYRVYSESKV